MHSKAPPKLKSKSKSKDKSKGKGEAIFPPKNIATERAHKSKKQKVAVPLKSASLSKTLKEAFQDCFEESKTHVRTSTSTRLDSIVEALSTKSLKSEDTLRQAETQFETLVQEWTVSILNQVTMYRKKATATQDGHPNSEIEDGGDGDNASQKYIKGSTSLQESMDKLQRNLDYMGRKLSGYAREWDVLVRDIDTVLGDILGPEFAAGSLPSIDEDQIQRLHEREEQLLKQDLDGLRAEYENSIDNAAEEFLVKMQRSEEKLDVRQRETRKHWRRLIEEEDQDQGV